MNRWRASAPLVYLLIACASVGVAADEQSADLGTTPTTILAPAQLPFVSEETTGTLEINIRHKVRWNRRTGVVAWDRLEIDAPETARFSVEPGAFDPNTTDSQRIIYEFELLEGKLAGATEVRGDRSWRAPVTIRLAPRDASWRDPEIAAKGLALDTDVTFDSRLMDGPLPSLERLVLRKFEVGSISAGVFQVDALTAEGRWLRPDWELDRLEGEIFGGKFSISGQGSWGTEARPSVSMFIRLDAVDIQPMLKAFEVENAEKIFGRIQGGATIAVRGTSWEQLYFEFIGLPGTVFIERQLVNEMNEKWLTAIGFLEAGEADKAIEGEFGDISLIPFERASIQGRLGNDMFFVVLMLENEALNYRIDINLERDVPRLWYDDFLEIALDQIQGISEGDGTDERR